MNKTVGLVFIVLLLLLVLKGKGNSINEEEERRQGKQVIGLSQSETIRITFNIEDILLDGLTDDQRASIERIFEIVRIFFESFIKVKRLKSNNILSKVPLFLQQRLFPDSDLSLGITNSDLHIYVF